MPNRLYSAAHSDPSLCQSICLSCMLLANWHLFYLGVCRAQHAQLARRRDACSAQPRNGGSGVWQLSQHRGRHRVQHQLRCGLRQKKVLTPGTCIKAEWGKPSHLHSPYGYKVPPQLGSVAAELHFALRLSLPHSPGTNS